MKEIRTRFAPSPTGFLHIGGARTALFNYLFARSRGGRFVLRIEDTDRKRSSPEYVEAILAGLAWLVLECDEGPFFQSERSTVYAEAVAKLQAADACYWCFCAPDELDAKRRAAQQEGRKAMYDRTCRDGGRLPRPGEKPVLRFRAPLKGETVVEDVIRGRVVFDNRELDDLILLRSDGTPTFHLVVVADDLAMGITHILRGEDHLSNTPRQIQIFHALGADPPVYGHMPLIVGKDRSRLSKRHGATSVESYREQGFLPEAMLNYLARLGWSHGDREIFSKRELIELFDLGDVGRAAAAFDVEKFEWVNFQHLKAADCHRLVEQVRPLLPEAALADDDYLEAAVGLLQERSKTLVDLAHGLKVFVRDHVDFEMKAVKKFLNPAGLELLSRLEERFSALAHWDQASIEAAFRAVMVAADCKLGQLAQPLRVALTGGTRSPGIFELCEVLGRERTLGRIERARAWVETLSV